MKKILFACLLVLAGCAEHSDGEACKTADQLLAGPDTKSLMGFSLYDAISSKGHLESGITWEPSSDLATFTPQGRSHVSFDLVYSGEPVYQRIVTGMMGTTDPSNAGACVSTIASKLRVLIKSDDGGLNDAFTADVVAKPGGDMEVTGWLDPSSLTGSFTVKATKDPKANMLFVAIVATNSEFHGGLTLSPPPSDKRPTGSDVHSDTIESALVADWQN